MIVVAIIGILAAVAIPQYQNYVARAQVSEGLSLASGAKTAVAEYFSTNGTFPADNTEAGLSDSGTISGNYVDSVTVSVDDGKALITALFSSTEAHSALQGKSMVLTAVDNGGSIGFACSGTDIESYLPSSCADVTGDPVVAVPADGTAWASLSNEAKASVTACWDPSVAVSADDNNGWVVGENSLCGEDAQRYKSYADGPTTCASVGNPVVDCSFGSADCVNEFRDSADCVSELTDSEDSVPVAGDLVDTESVPWVAGAMDADANACFALDGSGWVVGINRDPEYQHLVRDCADGEICVFPETIYTNLNFLGRCVE